MEFKNQPIEKVTWDKFSLNWIDWNKLAPTIIIHAIVVLGILFWHWSIFYILAYYLAEQIITWVFRIVRFVFAEPTWILILIIQTASFGAVCMAAWFLIHKCFGGQQPITTILKDMQWGLIAIISIQGYKTLTANKSTAIDLGETWGGIVSFILSFFLGGLIAVLVNNPISILLAFWIIVPLFQGKIRINKILKPEYFQVLRK